MKQVLINMMNLQGFTKVGHESPEHEQKHSNTVFDIYSIFRSIKIVILLLNITEINTVNSDTHSLMMFESIRNRDIILNND